MRHFLIALALLGAACGSSTEGTRQSPREVEALSRAAIEVEPEEMSTAVTLDIGPTLERIASEGDASLPEVDLLEVSPTTLGDLVDEAPSTVRTEQRFDLRRGETLAHFARWASLPVEDIAAQSDLSLSGTYPVGTEVILHLTTDERGVLDLKREQHRQRRIDGYLASRGGSIGVDTISVRTGESAWSIAREQQGIPVWLLESYNPQVDLESLRPGDTLRVPIIADVVVDAETFEITLDD